MMQTLVEWVQWLCLFYFLGLTGVYLVLNVVSIGVIRRSGNGRADSLMPSYSLGLEPGISIIVPGYNEQTNICMSVRSMMQLNYPDYEIVVVNDGSKDKTLQALIDEFDLHVFPAAYHMALKVQVVRAVYRSARYPRLVVVDKDNGGKADAINAGINIAQHALICAVDADSILDINALKGVAKPFMEDRRVVAVGGMIRIANGCSIVRGYLQQVAVPGNWLARFQMIEYLRAFLYGRMGWTTCNALLIISGAFGLFRRQTVIDVGGFNPKSIGEDMELIVRMHRVLRAAKKPYRIVYVGRPVCWTEAPENIADLKSQRVRWQRGLLDSLWVNRQVLFARDSGAVGWLAIPIFVFFEAIGPLIELVGFVFMLIAILLGYMSLLSFCVLLAATLALGFLLSAVALLMEEMAFHVYPKPKDLLVMAAAVFLENLGYRQINAYWRVLGVIKWLRGEPIVWGEMVRKGLGNNS
jgi:cellulose synthase/poly-beta-1,6-N-acetylglucosamine synthase-like glycosyltransferase